MIQNVYYLFISSNNKTWDRQRKRKFKESKIIKTLIKKVIDPHSKVK